MESILSKAISSAQNAQVAFCKFITANDVGATGAHQAGFHIHKNAWPLFFDGEGEKGSNKDKYITIKWQNDFETQSRFIYYGTGTRNEYRLTRFGRNFPYLHDENIGDLLVIVKASNDYYSAFVLHSDEDIDQFVTALNISSSDINGIIPKQFQQNVEDRLLNCFYNFISQLTVDFPPTADLAARARFCYNTVWGINPGYIKTDPDKQLLNWLEAEFQLFKTLENVRYSDIIKIPFSSVEEFITTANTFLNRRKSRAGKSLEHHLSEFFSIFHLKFDTQVITEDKKKPDFLFPGSDDYSNSRFDTNKLAVLASKTTCKDRWRQVLNEADRIKTKHLFTLQQGISTHQLEEMYKYNVCLVVPKSYLGSFPKEFRHRILTLESFIKHIRTLQS